MEKDVHSYTADQFYIHIGKLFYAVAAADKVVRKEEIKTMKEIVKREWIKIDDFKDEFGADAAFQIEIIFDWLNENQPEAGLAFSEFEEYLEEHKKQFTPRVKQLLWDTSNAIAASFAGKNKSEVGILSKLKIVLKNES